MRRAISSTFICINESMKDHTQTESESDERWYTERQRKRQRGNGEQQTVCRLTIRNDSLFKYNPTHRPTVLTLTCPTHLALWPIYTLSSLPALYPFTRCFRTHPANLLPLFSYQSTLYNQNYTKLPNFSSPFSSAQYVLLRFRCYVVSALLSPLNNIVLVTKRQTKLCPSHLNT